METTQEILIQIAVNRGVQTAYQPSTVLIDNKQYLVVPVVMMVEGVHNGSGGAIYHSAEQLAQSADKWQNVPVTISHPLVGDSYVSVHTEGIAEQYQVGYVSDPVMKNEKLTAKVYLDVQRMTAISPQTLLAVQEGKILEVSIGVFTDDEEVEGEWNGETYYKIARNHIPDHLALLPGEVGACSVKDGCGLRVNKNNQKEGGSNVIEVNEKFLKDLTLQGYSATLLTQAEGLQERVEKVRASLYAKDSNENEYYIEEVFDTYAVFRKYTRVKEGDYWKTTEVQLLRQDYTVNTDGSIVWVENPVKVVRNVEYIIVNDEKVETMCEPCKTKVNELIANESTHFNEDHREWLEALTEDKLDLLIPKVVKVNVAPTFDDAVKVIQTNAKGLDDYLGILPEEVKAEVQVGLSTFKEKKDAVIAAIQDNTEKDTWSVDELNAMPFQVLQKIEKSVVKADYSVNRIAGGKPEVPGVAPLTLA